MTTIVLLVCDLVAGIGAAIALAASVAVLIVALWFIVPLRQRGHPPDSAEEG
jgi:hypothetical protein